MSLGNDSRASASGARSPARPRPRSKDKLDKLKDEIKAGIRTPATYTVEQCVRDWLDSLKLDPGTMASYRGQAEKWIYPKLGARKLKELKATEVERFLNDVGKVLGKRSLMMINSTLPPLDPTGTETRPDRPERRRACRPAGRPARPPVSCHDPAAGRLSARDCQRHHHRLHGCSQDRRSTPRPLRTPRPRPANSRAAPSPGARSPRSAPTSRKPHAAPAGRNSVSTATAPTCPGWKPCSSCRSPSACALASYADCAGITSTSTRESSTSGAPRAGAATSRHPGRAAP